MKNSKLKTATIPNHSAEMSDISSPKARADRLEAAENRIKRFTKVSDSIAEHDHWMKNEPIPFGLELFPFEWFMRYSDLFYPYARGGKLYIDMPLNPTDIVRAEKKREAYQKKGIRYTYVKSNEGPTEGLMRLGILADQLPTGAPIARDPNEGIAQIKDKMGVTELQERAAGK